MCPNNYKSINKLLRDKYETIYGNGEKMLKKSIPLILGVFFILYSMIISGDCLAASSAVVRVTATVLAGQSEIVVDTTNINFGAVSGTISNRRFVAGPIKISYFAGTSPWTIRVYTNNPNHVPGLIGVTDPSINIPLKAWCDNYGPIAHQPGISPDEENRYFWSGYNFNGINGIESTPITTGPDINEATFVSGGLDVNGDRDATDIITPSPTKDSNTKYPVPEEPVWLRVPDFNEMDPLNQYTWRRLLTSAWANAPGNGGSGSGGGDGYSFPAFLAIDVTGAQPQVYTTATLTFQIIGE